MPQRASLGGRGSAGAVGEQRGLLGTRRGGRGAWGQRCHVVHRGPAALGDGGVCHGADSADALDVGLDVVAGAHRVDAHAEVLADHLGGQLLALLVQLKVKNISHNMVIFFMDIQSITFFFLNAQTYPKIFKDKLGYPGLSQGPGIFRSIQTYPDLYHGYGFPDGVIRKLDRNY